MPSPIDAVTAIYNAFRWDMAGGVPRDRFPEFVAWMFPLLGHDDRENMTRIWQVVMPPEVFPGAVQLVRQAIGDDFAELSRRIPDLAA